MAGSALISSTNHVEVPFIIVKIGKYTFGHCQKSDIDRMRSFNITYPNFLDSLNIVKVSGAVNTYTLTMVYAITHEDDPNKLEKVFSSVSNSRKIVLQYGDWSSPSFIYKEEEALITKLSTKVDVKSSSITYTLQCTSSVMMTTAGAFKFPAKRCKPSDEIKRIVSNSHYKLSSVFPGMTNKDLSTFIAGDDKVVQLEAKASISVFDYISYLVSCMVFEGDDSKYLKSSCYFWSCYDDTSNKYGGTYFKVIRVATNSNTLASYNTYELNIGYPTTECVFDFSINNDDSWSLLYNYGAAIDFPKYTYSLDSTGNIVSSESSIVTNSKFTYETNEATRNWWSVVTQFPITASVTLRGLLRPAMLMSYVKVNCYFYGKKHISSGLYIITKQQDSISKAGYRTTLNLTRVSGDEHIV